MLYVMFEAMEVKENAIFISKSTILDGRRCRRRRRRRRRRRENVEIKPPQPPVGIGVGSGAELGNIFSYLDYITSKWNFTLALKHLIMLSVVRPSLDGKVSNRSLKSPLTNTFLIEPNKF